MIEHTAIEEFYDAFSKRLLADYVYGNKRVMAQLQFLREAIAPNTRCILVVGCGSGQTAHFIAARVARDARVLALDISEKNISIATSLFSHKRVEYLVGDILVDPVPGVWDVVVLPDVYEHVPENARGALHARLRTLLAEHGKVLLTLPSPGHQEMLHASGSGLQIVDETVTLQDLQRLADDLNAAVSYFALISVWANNDYVHAVIERGALRETSIRAEDLVAIKRQHRVPPRLVDGIMKIAGRFSDELRTRLRRWRVRRVMGHDCLPVGRGGEADSSAQTAEAP